MSVQTSFEMMTLNIPLFFSYNGLGHLACSDSQLITLERTLQRRGRTPPTGHRKYEVFSKYSSI